MDFNGISGDGFTLGELPQGFGMALAMNEPALQGYADGGGSIPSAVYCDDLSGHVSGSGSRLEDQRRDLLRSAEPVCRNLCGEGTNIIC